MTGYVGDFCLTLDRLDNCETTSKLAELGLPDRAKPKLGFGSLIQLRPDLTADFQRVWLLMVDRVEHLKVLFPMLHQ